MKFVFSHSKLRKKNFSCWNFQNPGGPSPIPTPMADKVN